VVSIDSVMGGRGGLVRLLACMFSRPLNDQRISSRLSSVSGGGQPCATCHARMAAKYFLATATDTGSIGVPSMMCSPKVSGSADAHRVNEWSILNDAGSRSASGIENASQKIWNFRRPDP
jgi:hypothetical protein